MSCFFIVIAVSDEIVRPIVDSFCFGVLGVWDHVFWVGGCCVVVMFIETWWGWCFVALWACVLIGHFMIWRCWYDVGVVLDQAEVVDDGLLVFVHHRIFFWMINFISKCSDICFRADAVHLFCFSDSNSLVIVIT